MRDMRRIALARVSLPLLSTVGMVSHEQFYIDSFCSHWEVWSTLRRFTLLQILYDNSLTTIMRFQGKGYVAFSARTGNGSMDGNIGISGWELSVNMMQAAVGITMIYLR